MENGRKRLLEGLLASGVLNSPLLFEAFSAVDRADFVPASLGKEAYADYALPVMRGSTISQPTVVAAMLEALDVKRGQKILEVGLGSGYNAALLAHAVGSKGKIYAVEFDEFVFVYAKERLSHYPDLLKRLVLVHGDGSKGLPEKAPFDRVIVTAASPDVPKPLFEQLKESGKMVLPVSAMFGQDLMLVEKSGGKMKAANLNLPVVFVPLRGEHGFK